MIGNTGDMASAGGGAVGGHGRSAGHPAGLRTLFFTELWERFSYYGMRALLVLFMVAPANEGGLGFTTVQAAAVYGNYTMAVYMLAIPGGFLADRWLGAARAVLIGGAVIAAGHFTLALPSTSAFFVGLVLVAVGTGLFKPSISALVGHLYARDDERRDAGFSIFYMGINIGGFLAPLITGFMAQSPVFRSWLGAVGLDPTSSWHFGFAAAGIGMALGLMVFVRQSARFRDIEPTAEAHEAPPSDMPWTHAAGLIAATALLGGLMLLSDREGFAWLRTALLLAPIAAIVWFGTRPGIEQQRIAAILVFFMAAVVFWAIFEQAGITLSLFADQLTRNEIFGATFPSAWFQSLNSLFVIMLAPIFAATWSRMGAAQPASPIKFALGLGFLSLSFLLMVPAAQLTAEGRVSPLWLVGLFFLQTVGELFLSPVGLSTMTKLAPVRTTGLVLGIWFLGSAFGNKLAGVLGSGFTSADPDALAAFFRDQAILVAVCAGIMLALTPVLKRWMAGIR